MAGIQVRIKSRSGFRAASFSTSVTICPTRVMSGKHAVAIDAPSASGKARTDFAHRTSTRRAPQHVHLPGIVAAGGEYHALAVRARLRVAFVR